jgi:hypothetical protein
MYIDNQTEHHYPSEPLRLRTRKLIRNFVFRSCDFVYCRTSSIFALRRFSHFVNFRTSSLFPLCRLSHFVAFRTSSPFALHRLSHFVTCRALSHPISPHPYTYIFSLFSHSSHRLLKKGLTSTCTFLTFCRFILLQAYHRLARLRRQAHPSPKPPLRHVCE